MGAISLILFVQAMRWLGMKAALRVGTRTRPDDAEDAMAPADYKSGALASSGGFGVRLVRSCVIVL
jgi:hypothetical protein